MTCISRYSYSASIRLVIVCVAMLLSGYGKAADGRLFEAPHKTLLGRLLEQAALYDTYNRRCRGFRSSTYMENVSRLTVEKYGLTATQLVDQLWHIPLDSFRRRMDERFLKDVRSLGGCKQSKQQGYLDKLSEDYWSLRRRAESEP